MHDYTISYPPASLRLFEHGDAAWFIACARASRLEIGGWARIEIDQHESLAWFAVRSYLPRRGIGRALLAAACAWADWQRLPLSLTSLPHLVDWYEGAGFLKCSPPAFVHMADGQTYMVRFPGVKV